MLSRYEAQAETTWPTKLKISTAWPFTGKVCRPHSETRRRFLNWGASGSHCLNRVSARGWFCSHPHSLLRYDTWLWQEGGRKCRRQHSQPPALSAKGPRNAGNHPLPKTKKPTPIHHQGWRETGSPSENGGCVVPTSALTTPLETNTPTTSKGNFLLTMIKMKFCPKWNHFP